MGSSKSFLVQILSILLGQKANIYQLNSNSGITLFIGQSIIQNKLTEKEKLKIKPAYDSIKDLIEYSKDFDELNPTDFNEIISKLDEKIKDEQLEEDEIIKFKNARKTIYIYTAPPSKFQKEESKIVTSLRNGEWVILDGIEIASPIIPEKLSSLYSDRPEFNIFESGKGIYFSINSKENPIHENFRLFIT
jgi:midasin (ATPase involved in ribosome maturation)